MRATVLTLVSLQMKDAGNSTAADATSLQAKAAEARSNAAQSNSILYTNSRYAPAPGEIAPKLDQYLVDLFTKAQDLLKKQNAAAEEYNRWSSKGDDIRRIDALRRDAVPVRPGTGAFTKATPRPCCGRVAGVVAAVIWMVSIILS